MFIVINTNVSYVTVSTFVDISMYPTAIRVGNYIIIIENTSTPPSIPR